MDLEKISRLREKMNLDDRDGHVIRMHKDTYAYRGCLTSSWLLWIFQSLALWIHIYNVLVACLNEDCAEHCESLIGELEDFEVKGFVIRARVKIYIFEPSQ